MQQIQNVLFDLDGTLTDSAPGIIKALTCVSHKLKVVPPPVETLRDFIGKPLRTNFESFIPKDRIEDAVTQYYYCYDLQRLGLTHNRVHDGILPVLDQLQQNGKNLYLVTAKLRDFTLPILNLFGLEGYFKGVYAPERGPQTELSDQINVLLKEKQLAPSQTLFVGDRSFDFRRANDNGIGFVGVSWGYGGRDELQEVGAQHIIDTPDELATLLLRG